MKNLYPYFSQNPLDRLDQVRYDYDDFLELIKAKGSLFLLFDASDILVDEKNKKTFFTYENIEEYNLNKEDIVLLGRFENVNYFTISVQNKQIKELNKISLREFVNFDYINEDKLGILAQACSVLNWHNSHKFCSSCGKQTIIKRAGWKRDCPSCKKEHFPRVDSVVIMLVTFGDYCLIGQGVNFKENRYSCLAGYVESGETLEDAAKRELFEEAGIIGYEVEYMFSQPWPFPSTLMVGMRMKAASQELKLDKKEIADAIWVHKNDMRKVLNGSCEYDFSIPSKIAIARNLLEVWVNE